MPAIQDIFMDLCGADKQRRYRFACHYSSSAVAEADNDWKQFNVVGLVAVAPLAVKLTGARSDADKRFLILKAYPTFVLRSSD